MIPKILIKFLFVLAAFAFFTGIRHFEGFEIAVLMALSLILIESIKES